MTPSNSKKTWKSMEEVLLAFKSGEISLADAQKMLKGEVMKEIENMATIDLFRELRTGIPEIIFAESKTLESLDEIITHFLEEKGLAIVSRLNSVQLQMITNKFFDKLDYNENANIAIIKSKPLSIESTGGKVGIITAGTSDIPIAEEAAVICKLMGCEVKKIYDVGIAGIHRIFKPLQDLIESDVDVLICCAGMEGALPSVVASLTDLLVIGVPISTGYGFGGKGETAIKSMLQSCSPGLVVVNIDNGIGAGAAAALVANRMGRLKKE
ncbi:MAG: nickel pincer cofactor biosynthesis protein LarB [Candidatus Hodarchaeota archaeon]